MPATESERQEPVAVVQRIPLIPPRAVLSDTMMPAMLIAALERLPFVGADCVVRIDKGVRDYLVRTLKHR